MMTQKYKILGKYIKDLSSETKDVETYLFVRDNISKYQLGIDITSKALKNKMVEVNFPILGRSYDSSIRQVGNFINPSNRTFRIEVGIPNLDGEIKPNLTAKLRLNDYSSSNAILIPQSIISENAKGQQFIYVVKDNKEKNQVYAERLVIETGKTNGDFIEVTKNLDANVEVILEGARSVNNGQVVKVINKK